MKIRKTSIKRFSFIFTQMCICIVRYKQKWKQTTQCANKRLIYTRSAKRKNFSSRITFKLYLTSYDSFDIFETFILHRGGVSGIWNNLYVNPFFFSSYIWELKPQLFRSKYLGYLVGEVKWYELYHGRCSFIYFKNC